MSNKELNKPNDALQQDSWQELKKLTRARIALGNTGGSLPIKEVLSFQMAHANAKDAVYATLHIERLRTQIQTLNLPTYVTASKAANRTEYLKRPDLGRSLNENSVALLSANGVSADIVFVIADGLSAEAVNKHAYKVLSTTYKLLKDHYTLAVVLTQQGRVAIGDEIGVLLNSKLIVIMIGERPGLSSPESMGIYTTYAPEKGMTDERRNCISNIHSEGLDYEQATRLLYYLITQSFLRKESGVMLKLDHLPPEQID